MSVVAASGEVLAVVDTLVADTNEDAAFAACEHALSAGRVQRNDGIHRVALYNPYTAQTAYLPAPESIVFCDGSTLSLGAGGEAGRVGEDADGITLEVGGRKFPVHLATVASSSRDWQAHESQ